MYMRIARVKSYDRKRVHDGESMHFPAARYSHVANRRPATASDNRNDIFIAHRCVTIPGDDNVPIDIIYDARCVTNASFIHVAASCSLEFYFYETLCDLIFSPKRYSVVIVR